MRTRRQFLIGLAALYAIPGRAQPAERAGKPMRVGILSQITRANDEPGGNGRIFVDAMREMGWVEGRSILYDRVYADNDESRLPALAAELVARDAQLIWVVTTPSALAAFAKTRTIPIVVATGTNMVERGLVKTLARPGAMLQGSRVSAGNSEASVCNCSSRHCRKLPGLACY